MVHTEAASSQTQLNVFCSLHSVDQNPRGEATGLVVRVIYMFPKEIYSGRRLLQDSLQALQNLSGG